MHRTNAIAGVFFLVILGAGAAVAYPFFPSAWAVSVAIVVVAFAVASLLGVATNVAAPWDRAIVLRLGRFRALRGPGLFFIIPIVDTIAYWIDVRVITSSFKAEKTLTRDTVPVDVDAVLFWKVVDRAKGRARRRRLRERDQLGRADRASRRDRQDACSPTCSKDGRRLGGELQRIIDERTEPWGVQVISVEVRDVLIPAGLEDAMSMQAQAERERQARVILGDSERQVAEKFGEAAKTYANDPIALHLRAMNMLYEGLKQNATIVLVPSTALDTMQLGALTNAVTRATEPVAEAAEPLRHH